jgi:transposase InsO family protein
MSERKRFVDLHLQGEHSIAELCRRFRISRKTGYKWLRRFFDGCELVDRSRRPLSSPHAVARWLEEAIVDSRRQRPHWGPKKLHAVLLRANPGAELPSVSTFAAIFKRNGLVRPRRRRRQTPPSSTPFGQVTAPNSLWCVDFKGDFAVGRTRCYPLTVTDAFSRYLIACVALRSTSGNPVRRAFEQIFDAFGLPDAIRSDNGTPFASRAVGGLSALSAWWLKLGIRHERIEPGKPQQNGRHERMHLTLKQETTLPAAHSLRAQQAVFDRFRHEFNDERPHEALGQKRPAEFYLPSTRRLPDPPWRDFDYGDETETHRIDHRGYLHWNERRVFVSQTLAHELVAIDWHQDCWRLRFANLQLGVLRPRRSQLHFEEQVLPMSMD